MSATTRRGMMVIGWLAVIALVAGAVAWVGPQRLLAPWLAIEPAALLVALLLMLASYVVRTLRVTRYFRARLAGHFWPTLRLSSWHNLMNNLLPMRSGELSFPLLMRRYYGLSPMQSLPVLLWFRLLDLQVVLLIGLLAGGVLLGLAAGWVAVFLLLLISPLGVYALRHWLHSRLSRHADGWRARLVEVLESLPDHPRLFLGTLFWTWVNWLIKLCALGWVLAALAPVSFFQGVIGAIGGDLTTVLPVHAPGGFGTYEAGVALLIGPFVDDTKALVAAAVNLHLFVLGTALLAAVISLAIKRPARR